MADTPDLDRLALVERAQLLHDATLRRHIAMLDAHAATLARHEMTMAALRDIQERQQSLIETLTGITATLTLTLAAIKDLLDRGNGH
jgi:hypothetical protein